MGQVPTFMRVLMNIDGDLIPYFDKISETEAGIKNTSLTNLLINNHDIHANEAKTKGQLPLEHVEHVFGICKILKRYRTIRISSKF